MSMTKPSASQINFTPSGTLSSTNVQSAITELVTDLAAASGSSMVGYLPAGTGAVSRTVQSKLRDVVSVFDFMTDAEITDVKNKTLTLDVSSSIQKAIEYSATRVGTEILLPAGSYRVDVPINLTSDNSISRAFVRITGAGYGTVIMGNTGGRLFDCVGSNHLHFKSFYIFASLSNPSSLGFLFARGLAVNYSHFQKIEDVIIFLPSMHTANNNFGSIGVLNVEGEDHTYINLFSAANSPLVMLRKLNTSITYTSYVPLSITPVSFGACSLVGKTTLQAWNSWKPSLYIDGVNTLFGHQVHCTSGVSPLDSDTIGTETFAIRTGSTEGCAKIFLFGLIEVWPQLIQLGHNIQDSTIDVLLAGSGMTVDTPLVDLLNHGLYGSKLNVTHGDPIRRTFITGIGPIQGSSLYAYNTFERLSPLLVARATNTTFKNDRRETTYGRNTTEAILVDTPTPINYPSGAIAAYIQMPLNFPGGGSGYSTINLKGVISTWGVSTQSEQPSLARFNCDIDVTTDVAGAYGLPTVTTTISTPYAFAPSVALILSLDISAAINPTTKLMELTFIGNATGTGAFNNNVNLVNCIASANWGGFSGNTGVVL